MGFTVALLSDNTRLFDIHTKFEIYTKLYYGV